MSLEQYKKKRNFKRTTEPKGKIKKTKEKRFVIQYHKARANHYDFRLEHNGILLSWAVPKGLSLSPEDKRLAVHVEDHPLEYMNFEGIIPKGNYGAGTVEIFDKGTYKPLVDMDEGLTKGHIKILLDGQKNIGEWSLIRMDKKNWIIVKKDDKYVKDVKKKKNSTLPFKTCDVQLATLCRDIPKSKDYIYEIKYDGYRMVSYVDNGTVKIVSRNNNDYTSKFKEIVESLKKIDEKSFVLDGEIVVFDDKGRSDFGLLQKSIKEKNCSLYYVIFDLLSINGEDLREQPLLKRKERLERLLFECNENLFYAKHVYEGKECFNFALKNNLEGIIAKNINSKYQGKRNKDWLKIKCSHRQEFVIAGYTTTEKNNLLSALLLGYYQNKELVYVGKVGTGFNEESRRELHHKFKKYIQKKCPFKKVMKKDNIFFLKPKFVCEIKYTELTKDHLLRQPSFIALREDKDPKEIFLETAYENN